MNPHYRKLYITLPVLFSLVMALLSACGGGQAAVESTAIPASPTVSVDIPGITSVEMDGTEITNYESVEFTLGVEAKYSNPYDAREVAVNGIFTDPDGKKWNVPGFWDGEEAWKIRFTPSLPGEWKYSFVVADVNGTGSPTVGRFSVKPSDSHGWIITGNSFDSSYSPHYLVYHDGTPFYGVGYCEALNILIDGFDIKDGVGLFDNMKEANANYVVWWPMYTNSLVGSNYDSYALGNMKVIDAVVQDAEKEGIVLVFTVWDHPNLRDDTHAWGDGNWARNGFSKLGDLDSFFVSDEAWVWQENLYRYIIARWGYSTSIGMWQTVSEINGTNAYDQTDAWHEKVNSYFVRNDPYRHPTTASGSGEVEWSAGFNVMDMPQVHLYDFGGDVKVNVVGSAKHVADWTQKMLKSADKPNWVGEFGVKGNSYYPELFHNSIWSALGSGAAMTPAEWNSGGSWGRVTPEMNADLGRLAFFVADLPLAKWKPSALQIGANQDQIRGWGIAGQAGGLMWIQDYSLEGESIDDVRNRMPVRSGAQVEVSDLEAGVYEVAPYDTWQGVFLAGYEVECQDKPCVILLPDFRADMAVRLFRK